MLRNHLYYTAKPFLPSRLRLALRRWHAKWLLRRSEDVWPILPSAGRKPPGWPGWPDDKQFAFVLTHDVEGQVGLDRVRPLADLEMSLGFRSAFYFIPEGPYRVPPSLILWLQDNGFEVGVHDLYHDGRLLRNRETFRRHAIQINRYLRQWDSVGFRAGFMLHKLDWFHDLDIQYDASTFDTDPFEPQPDGTGTIFPFWVPNPDRAIHEPIRTHQTTSGWTTGSDFRSLPCHRSGTPVGRAGYVELPYTIPQDFTVFRLLRETGIALWKRKVAWVAQAGGMAMVNIHPDYTCLDAEGPARDRLPLRAYQTWLQWVGRHYEQQCWVTLPRLVATLCSQDTRVRMTSATATPGCPSSLA